jgi:chromosome segregation ATPase
MELSYSQKRILDAIKDDHRRLQEAQVVLKTNKYYDTVVRMAEEYLAKDLERAAEAEIPSEMIAEATSYRPVSKLREEIVELNRRVSHYQEMLEARDADRQSLREEIEAYQRVQVGMQKEYEDLYATLNRAKGRFGGIATVSVFLGLVWAGTQVLEWAGLATSSPMAFVVMLGTAFVGTLATMIAIDSTIDG